MRTRDITRDREPETGPTLILIARVIEPQKRLEYFLTQVRGDARTVIIDRNSEIPMIAVTDDCNRRCKARRVRYKIAEAAFESRRANGNDWRPVKNDTCPVSVALGVGPQLFQKFRHICLSRSLAAVAARKSEIGLQHTGHLVGILFHRVDFRRFFDQSQFELEARKHCPQIMRHARQHRRTLFHRAFNARLHLDKRSGRAPHLASATRSEVWRFSALTETFRSISK